jgi:cytochrome c-type protein NapC
MHDLSPLAILTLLLAGAAALLLLAFLAKRPSLAARATKVWLLLALGVLPIGAALAANVEGYETTKRRTFCGSCHVMDAHARDAADPRSSGLAARHTRNEMFGHESCYTCHADYGMFGTIVTKMGGLGHVYWYYTEYHDVPLDEALRTIHIRRPYPNANCMHCHSTENELWRKVPDHASSVEDARAGRVSCASGGCHGYAHPFTKPARPAPEATP